MNLTRQIASDLIRKFPKSGSWTLARIAYKENPECWPNVKAARACIASIRGKMGKRNAGCVIPELQMEKQGPNANSFPNIPDGLTHFNDWQAVQMDGPMRCLVLSDLHIPYHDKTAIVAALRYGQSLNCDTVLLNGDIADFFSVSFWEKDPRKRRFADELKTVQAFMVSLRAYLPKARIIFKEGNHEERWQRYMFVKAPELLGVPDFDLREMMGLGDIEMVGEKRPIRLGRLNVLHGHEYKFQISNPVNPARGLFLRCKAHALCGHFHQKSEHSARTVEHKNIACWSAGCLCDLHPDYAVFNEWSHGFAFVEVDKDGGFEVQNKYVSDGKVY